MFQDSYSSMLMKNNSKITVFTGAYLVLEVVEHTIHNDFMLQISLSFVHIPRQSIVATKYLITAAAAAAALPVLIWKLTMPSPHPSLLGLYSVRVYISKQSTQSTFLLNAL